MLNQAGLASAQAASKAGLTPQALQTQLLRHHEVDLSTQLPLAQVQPGKLWSELATDLFISNMQQPNWGWADPQSAVLMDFWHQFDPQIRLLLVYNSPANYLSQVLSQSPQPTAQTVVEALADWTRWNTALLRYVHRHPDYCLLVSSQHATAQPQLLLSAVAQHWQINELQASAISAASQPDYQHLQAHLISQLIDPNHSVWALHQELEGSALQIPAEPDSEIIDPASLSASRAWADWSRLRSRLTQLANNNLVLIADSEELRRARDLVESQLATESKAKSEAHAQHDQATKEKAALAQQRDALQTEKAHLSQQLELLKLQLAQTAQANSEATKMTAELAELRQENELHLVQLHQVQEELETYFLKNQALSQVAEKSEQLAKDLASLQSQRDSLAKEKTELVKGRDVQAKLLQERQTQLDLAAKAQEAATKAKEQQSKLVADLQLAMVALQTQKEQLTKEKAALTRAKDIETMTKAEATKAEAELAEQKQENELLLLQLHQVQEELEHYFLRAQDLEKSYQAKATGFVTDFWRMHQPQELRIDMQHEIVGRNWYPAESDGRWAGPATLSTLQMPPVQPGNYTLELDIVDAMNPVIVNELVIEALGRTLPVEVSYPLYKGEYPLICTVQFAITPDAAQQPWQIGLRFTQMVCPADNGSDDQRNLAVRLRSIKLVKQA